MINYNFSSSGLPALSEHVEMNHDIQIKKIKQVLISSIESNSKAWAPVIFQVTFFLVAFFVKNTLNCHNYNICIIKIFIMFSMYINLIFLLISLDTS